MKVSELLRSPSVKMGNFV